MKTNQFARSILKIRIILFLMATVAMGGVGYTLGQSPTLQHRHLIVLTTESPQNPSVSLADAMAAAR